MRSCEILIPNLFNWVHYMESQTVDRNQQSSRVVIDRSLVDDEKR